MRLFHIFNLFSIKLPNLWNKNPIQLSSKEYHKYYQPLNIRKTIQKTRIFIRIYHIKQRKRKIFFAGSSLKSVPNLSIQNNIQKIKMSYTQQFLEVHLPQYYLSTLKSHLNSKGFLDFTQSNSLYTLTIDLLNLAHFSPTSYFHRQWLSSLISRQLLIDYDTLRNYRLPVSEKDSAIVQNIKSSLSYVQNCLLQLLLHLIGIFLECYESQYLNNTTLTLISEFSYIYPLLKTQISINNPDINLALFLQKYLDLSSKNCHSQAALLALEKIKSSCNFIGPTEKTIDQLILQKKNQIDNRTKKIQFSSNQSEQESDRQTKNTKQNSKHFNEADIFRKKKQKYYCKTTKNGIIKPTKTMTTIEATPTKQKIIGQKFTPKTPKNQNTSEIKSKQTSKSPLKKTPLFKKIRKQKRPLERTIYYGQTKKFIPKKLSSSQDHFDIRLTLGAKIMISQPYLFQTSKKTEKKINREHEDLDNVPLFCVPETPRPPQSKKIKTEKRLVSNDLFKDIKA